MPFLTTCDELVVLICKCNRVDLAFMSYELLILRRFEVMDTADSIKLTSCDQVSLYWAPIKRGQRGVIRILPDLCLPRIPDHFACCVVDVPDLDAIRARGKQVIHG